MGVLKDHLQTSAELVKAVDQYRDKDDWPIAVDAGFYAVYHMLEAIHALDYRDTSTFADGFDLIERILVPLGLSNEFEQSFNFLFYFRRGTIYGPHVPSEMQLRKYLRVANDALTEARALYERREAEQGAVV